MVISEEDNISIDEVIQICKSVKFENIEIKDDNILNQKTSDFMAEHSFTPDDVRREIKKLTVRDYHAGPCEDKNSFNNHPVWIFIKNINRVKILVYIKIKIINHKRKIIVYSFHEEGLHDEKK